jgi:uncharacterized protein (TIGR03083 family)
MTDDDLQPAVAQEFLALADLLEALPEARWDNPSLCEGWRVREVVAHMTMGARYTPEQFFAELGESEGDFTLLSNRIAERDGALPIATLVGYLRDDVMLHWTPPGGGFAGALNHVVIHGLDITVPLGVTRRSSDATIRLVLDDLTVGGTHERFGFDLDGLALQATDIDWTFGSGKPMTGPAADLVLLMCGRRLTTAG